MNKTNEANAPALVAGVREPEVTRCYGPFGYSYVPAVVTVEGAAPCDTTEVAAPEPETRKGLREIHKAWEESGDGLPALIRDVYEQGFLDGRVSEEESDRGKVLTDEQIAHHSSLIANSLLGQAQKEDIDEVADRLRALLRVASVQKLTDEKIIQIADQTFAKFSDAAIGDEWFVSFAHSIISATQAKGSES